MRFASGLLRLRCYVTLCYEIMCMLHIRSPIKQDRTLPGMQRRSKVSINYNREKKLISGSYETIAYVAERNTSASCSLRKGSVRHEARKRIGIPRYEPTQPSHWLGAVVRNMESDEVNVQRTDGMSRAAKMLGNNIIIIPRYHLYLCYRRQCNCRDLPQKSWRNQNI